MNAKTENAKTYSTKSVAVRGALRQLGKSAKLGRDFDVKPTDDGRFEIAMLVAKAAKERKAKAPRVPGETIIPRADGRQQRHPVFNREPIPAATKKRDPEAMTLGGIRETFTGRSIAEGPVAIVFDLCDKMKGARRRDVIAAAVAQGVGYNTARSQYQNWYTAQQGRTGAKRK